MHEYRSINCLVLLEGNPAAIAPACMNHIGEPAAIASVTDGELAAIAYMTDNESAAIAYVTDGELDAIASVTVHVAAIY